MLEGEDFAPTPGYVLPGFHGLLKNLPVGLGHRVTLTIHLKHYPHPAVAQPRSRRQRYGLVVILRRSRRIYRPQNLFLSQNLLLQELLRIDKIPVISILYLSVIFIKIFHGFRAKIIIIYNGHSISWRINSLIIVCDNSKIMRYNTR